MDSPAQPPPPPLPPFAGSHAAPPETLTPEQIGQIAQAKVLGGKIRRALAIAKGDGWTIAIFGGLTLLLGIGSVPAMVLGLAMLGLGVLQLRCAKELAQLQPASVRLLAAHQFILGGLIALYALSMMWVVSHDPHPLAEMAAGDAQIAQMLEPYAGLARTLSLGFYLVVAVAGGMGCAAMALYYRSREKYVARYRQETPAWILELQRAGMGL